LELRARGEARSDLTTSYVGEGKLSAASGIFSTEVRVVVVVRKPGELRVEVLSPTDDLLLLATANAERVVQWERGADVCFVSAPCPGALRALLPVSLSPELLTQVLLGAPPALGQPTDREWDEEHGFEVLRGTLGTGEAAVGWHPVERDPRRFEFLPAASAPQWETGFEVQWGQWQGAGTARYPRTIEVALDGSDIALALAFAEMDPSFPLDAGAFEFRCPMGVREQEVGCE
jgi:hypothetical protein